MFRLVCSQCGPYYSDDDYMENGVCGPCLLVNITEELGLYESEEVDFARNKDNGSGLFVRQER